MSRSHGQHRNFLRLDRGGKRHVPPPPPPQKVPTVRSSTSRCQVAGPTVTLLPPQMTPLPTCPHLVPSTVQPQATAARTGRPAWKGPTEGPWPQGSRPLPCPDTLEALPVTLVASRLRPPLSTHPVPTSTHPEVTPCALVSQASPPGRAVACFQGQCLDRQVPTAASRQGRWLRGKDPCPMPHSWLPGRGA